MAKKPRSHHKKQSKWLEILFIGLIVAFLALMIVRAFIPQPAASNDQVGLMVTEEGHVHTTDGQHVGTYEEVFGVPWENVVNGEAPADGETATPTEAPVDGETVTPTEAPAEPTAEPAA